MQVLKEVFAIDVIVDELCASAVEMEAWEKNVNMNRKGYARGIG